MTSKLDNILQKPIVVRSLGGKSIKLIDTAKYQKNGKLRLNRYNRINSHFYQAPATGFTGKHVSNNQLQETSHIRRALYQDYEIMDEDALISSALDIYASESTVENEYGDVLTIKSNNINIKKVLHNLFYDILQIPSNLSAWTRSMCKYGDFFLLLEKHDTYGIVGGTPISPYFIEREQGYDANNPEYIRYRLLDANYNQSLNAQSLSLYGNRDKDQKYFDYSDIAHFTALDDINYLPYGKSLLEGARNAWKRLTLLEQAMLIHRLVRAPDRRIYKIDVGSLPPNAIPSYMNNLYNNHKRTPVLDDAGRVNFKYNVQNITEDIYMPVRGGRDSTNIETLSGLSFSGIDDLEYEKNKVIAGLKIPRSFLGYTEELNGKSTLAQQDVRFSKTMEKIQQNLIVGLEKIAIIHLYLQGYGNEELMDFNLSLNGSSVIAEQEKIEMWSQKFSLARDASDANIVSKTWIRKNVFGMSELEITEQDKEIIHDKKVQFRLEQIENSGNDPVKSGTIEPPVSNLSGSDENEGGRPKEINLYDKKDSVKGYDVFGMQGSKEKPTNAGELKDNPQK